MPASKATQPSDDKPVYFWKPHQNNGYLGQWYKSDFSHEGDTYLTAEMWMMVQKARLFGDEKTAQKMFATTDPKKHRALGRQVKGFREDLWNEKKLDIVEEGTYLKFTTSTCATSLREQLIATGERPLVEASPFDRIWGIGFDEKDAEASRKAWGENLLGEALMRVRMRLVEESMGNGN